MAASTDGTSVVQLLAAAHPHLSVPAPSHHTEPSPPRSVVPQTQPSPSTQLTDVSMDVTSDAPSSEEAHHPSFPKPSPNKLSLHKPSPHNPSPHQRSHHTQHPPLDQQADQPSHWTLLMVALMEDISDAPSSEEVHQPSHQDRSVSPPKWPATQPSHWTQLTDVSMEDTSDDPSLVPVHLAFPFIPPPVFFKMFRS